MKEGNVRMSTQRRQEEPQEAEEQIEKSHR